VSNAGTACEGEPHWLTAFSGTIRSPGYDSSTYPNDANCQWIIEAPAGKVRLKNTFYYYLLIHFCIIDVIPRADRVISSENTPSLKNVPTYFSVCVDQP